MSIKNLITEIADINEPLVNSHLADLSQMTPADLRDFEQAWKTIDSKRRREIITRLVELVTDSVELNFDLIYKICLSDPDADVRSKAIEGLWENEDPSLIQPFINLMNKDPSEKVQAFAAMALGRFAIMAEFGTIRPKYKNIVGQVLLAVINDTNKTAEVQRRALEAVAPLSIQPVKEAIKKAYESNNERLVVSAIHAMGKNCDLDWMPILLNELVNRDAEIRYEAAYACGEIGSEEIVQYLIPLIQDDDVDVRQAAAQALGKIGGEEAKQNLKKFMPSSDEATREAIAQALSEIETQDDMTLLRMPLQEEDED